MKQLRKSFQTTLLFVNVA